MDLANIADDNGELTDFLNACQLSLMTIKVKLGHENTKFKL